VTGKLYAMKVISKKHILDSDKVDQIISERKIFSMLSHPFIVQLHCAFTSVSQFDANNLEKLSLSCT
jgi:serine/threonine protein kinase